MTERIHLARRAAICGAFLWVLQGSGAALAGPCLPHPCLLQPCLPHPCGSGCVCIPNVQGFGYFHTRWRQWPNEPRPEIYFPRSVGAEVLPTPAGEKQAPLSKPGLFPEEPPAIEGMLPPEGDFRLETEPPFRLEQPPVPGESPPGSSVEEPAESPQEKPAEPPLVIPGDAPSQSSKDTTASGPLVQSSWATPTEEPRETAPLLQPSWLGGLPARQPNAAHSEGRRGAAASEDPAPRTGPAEDLEPEIPALGAESPKHASRPGATTLRLDNDEKVNGQDRDTSAGATAKAPRDTALLRPLVPSGWAALAEEPRAMPPLLQPGWVGRSPAHSVGHPDAPPTGGQPDVGHSIPSNVPADHPQPEAPDVRTQSPKLPLQPLSGEGASRGESDVLETSGDRPSDQLFDMGRAAPNGWKEPQSGTLQANWNAALHPGLYGDVRRATGRYPSVERATAAVHQTAVAPSRVQENAPPNGRQAAPTLWKQSSEQPGKPPTDRLHGTQEVGSPPVVPEDPVALDGYCAVELGEKERWLPGNPRWSVAHQGQTYLFSGPAQRQRFLANPRRYVPAYSAHDPVLAVDRNLRVPGHTDYCVMYDGQLYMFSSSVTLARFQENPGRYTVGGRK